MFLACREAARKHIEEVYAHIRPLFHLTVKRAFSLPGSPGPPYLTTQTILN